MVHYRLAELRPEEAEDGQHDPRRELLDNEAQVADHHAAERDERNRARLDDRTEYRRVGGGWYDVDDLPDAQDVL